MTQFVQSSARSSPSGPDLRRLTTLSAISIAVAGAVLIAIIVYAGWASNMSSLNRERTLLENGINRRIARTLNEQKSVAWWDDSVTKITDQAIDLDFTDANFGVFLTETYGHDEVYILDADDKPLYSFARHSRREPASFEAHRRYVRDMILEARGRKQAALSARPDAFGSDQTNYRKLRGAAKAAHWAGHIMSINGRLALVAAISIVPNVDMTLLQGTPKLLISIKYIDANFIDELGSTLLLTNLALMPAPSHRDGVYSQLVTGDDGSYGGYLTWRMERPGHVLLTSILPMVVMGVIAAAILANGMLGRLKTSSAELAEREKQSRYDASHDALSDLPNRPHFSEKLKEALRSVPGELGDKHALVAYIDIDRFKEVNDTLGHHAGDELIKAVAVRLQSQLRPDDVLSRYGGDEFAILWMSSNPEAAERLAKRVRDAFEARFDVHGQSLAVTASTGIAVANSSDISADELMRRADIALYEAKTQGRNRSVMFAEEMAKRVEERRAIELDLRVAIDENQLRLNYQPIISCRTGEITGVEALLRWRHPVKGEIPPFSFISIAEQAGLMPDLGHWVMRRAMDDWWKWPHLQVSVNLSPAQFRQVNIEAELKELIAETRINPSRFVLEITEGVLMEATDRTSRTLQAIHDLGFKTALDDFGTGYSSLSYLCNFRFDKIKIDRSFVAGMSKSDGYRKIVNAVIALGKGLGMDIVAEGVETEAEANAMTQFGCTDLQGYYFSRPIETDQMSALLTTYVAKVLLPPQPVAETQILAAAG